jgi:hypothetical protein
MLESWTVHFFLYILKALVNSYLKPNKELVWEIQMVGKKYLRARKLE